jgi:hypothetical protein
LLADVVTEAFTAQDGVHVDRIPDAGHQLSVATARHDVVIAAVDDPWRDEARTLMEARRELLVLGIRPDGRDAWIYEMHPCPREIGALNPEQLRRTVLDALTKSGHR